jgi:hypothetical protein
VNSDNTTAVSPLRSNSPAEGVMSPYDQESDSDEDVEMFATTRDLLGIPGSRRRRKLLALWARSTGHRVNRQTKRIFNRLSWEEHVKFLGPREFRRYYKLTPTNFERVLHRIRPDMERQGPKNTSDKKVDAKIMFACTLRWLAGGNYMDIKLVHGISETSFWNGIHLCVLSLLTQYCEEQLGTEKFKDPEWLQATELTFAKLNGGAMRGCIFAVDGMAVRISKPALKDCPNPYAYYSRKGFYSIVLQAMCDGDGKFSWGSMKCAGSTHDSTSWCVTELARSVFLLYCFLNVCLTRKSCFLSNTLQYENWGMNGNTCRRANLQPETVVFVG